MKSELQRVIVREGAQLLRRMALSACVLLLVGGASRVFAQTDTSLQTTVPVASAPSDSAAPTAATAASNGTVAASDGKGKKGKKKKEKAPKQTPMNIVQGTLTVDGWTGKARLNYDIADLKFVYMWAPGVGTVVIANSKFPLAKEEPNAFSGNTLTVTADGHALELYSQKRLLKDKKPSSAWVYLDTAYRASSSFPQMGYGTTMQAPYAWPGAKDVAVAKGTIVPPPPLPVGMQPALAKTPCAPTGGKMSGTPCPVAPAAASPSANALRAATP